MDCLIKLVNAYTWCCAHNMFTRAYACTRALADV